MKLAAVNTPHSAPYGRRDYQLYEEEVYLGWTRCESSDFHCVVHTPNNLEPFNAPTLKSALLQAQAEHALVSYQLASIYQGDKS